MSTYEKLAGLPLEVEGYDLEPLEQEVSSDFTRASTVIHLRGGGHEGVGEDVTYDALDHVALQEAGPVQDLAGSWTLGSFFDHVGGLDLFPAEPVRETSRYSGAGGSRARRSTWRCARRASRSRMRSGASCGRSRSSCRCDSASRRRSSRSAAASSATRACGSSSTRRPSGPTS